MLQGLELQVESEYCYLNPDIDEFIRARGIKIHETDEIKKEYIKRNLNCTVDYLYVNSNNIADSLIEITDSEILDDYNNQKEDRYKIEKSKVVEYILWENPDITEDDSLDILTIQDSLYQEALLFSEDVKIVIQLP